MRKYLSLYICIVYSIISCNSIKKVNLPKLSIEEKSTNILRVHQSEEVTSIFPTNKLNDNEKTISQQVFEGLLKYNPSTLKLENCLLDNYQVDSTYTKYRFELKPNIKFHKSSIFKTEQDRVLTSDDILYCFNELYKTNEYYSTILLNNETKKYTTDTSINGLKKNSKYTFTIELNKPDKLFLHHLAEVESSIYPQEMINFSYDEKLLESVGTGPYIVKSNQNKRIKLTKNIEYYLTDTKGYKLPYLNEIQFIYEQNIDSALTLFERGQIDLIKHLQSEVLFNLQYLKHQGQIHIDIKHQPMASLDFIGLNKTDELTQHQQLRNAISLALNKRDLLNRSLNGEADHPSNHGFTPEVFKIIGYDVTTLLQNKQDLDSAKTIINSTTFPADIKNLTLSYDKDDFRHRQIAKSISITLKKLLNIDLLTKPLSLDSLNKSIEKKKYQLFLKTYDYNKFNHFEFLQYLVDNGLTTDQQKTDLNKLRQNNSKDISFKLSLTTESKIANSKYIIPLWSNEYYEIMQPDIENLQINAIQYYDFRKTFIRQIDQIKPIN